MAGGRFLPEGYVPPAGGAAANPREEAIARGLDPAARQERRQEAAGRAGAHWLISFEDFQKALAPYTLDFVAEMSRGDRDEPLDQHKAKLQALADEYAEHLRPDPEVDADPERFYDRVIEVDLDDLEPHVVGPHTPDLDRPISEPFVGLLIELNWESGRLSREYTFLLDPVDIAPPKPVAAPVSPSPAIARPPSAPAVATAPRPVADRYTVQRGDTLRRIAEQNRHEGTSLDQMLVALFRANPSAFDGENINRLRAGAVLSVPSAEVARQTSPAEARKEILAQAADFEAYRQRLAGAVSTRAAEPAPAAQASNLANSLHRQQHDQGHPKGKPGESSHPHLLS